LLDFALTLSIEEFVLYEWMFLADYLNYPHARRPTYHRSFIEYLTASIAPSNDDDDDDQHHSNNAAQTTKNSSNELEPILPRQNILRRPIITIRSLEELQKGSLAMLESEDLPNLIFNDFLGRVLSHWYYVNHQNEILATEPDRQFMEKLLCLDFVE
jgi:hypothetical protein